MRTIAGNAHLALQQEVHWIVSIRWRAQSGLYLLDEWTDISDSAFDVDRLYDGFQPSQVTTEPLMLNLSEFAINSHILDETGLTFEVNTVDDLAGHPGSTFKELWSGAYPAEYADVFITCALGTSASRTSVLMWAGAIEAVEFLEERVRITAVDQTRKLLLPLTDRIDTVAFPLADPGDIGVNKPLAIGEVEDFPGRVVVQQFSSFLDAAITSADTSMAVGSTNDFPASGQVIVNGEWISYASKTDITLDGLTRGEKGSAAAGHPAGSVVSASTGQVVGGVDCDGPVFLIHGAPLTPASVIRAVRSYADGGLTVGEVPAGDYAVDLSNPDGAIVGLVKSWPQSPVQAAASSWYAIEMDTVGVNNLAVSPENAVGTHANFLEGNFSLAYKNNRLIVKRSGAIAVPAAQKIEQAYILVEYGNMSNPDPDGLSIPNAGQNASVGFWDNNNGFHILGSLYPADSPLPEEIDDPMRTVRTRALDDQHRHSLSGAAGVVGPTSSIISLDMRDFDVRVPLPSNAGISSPLNYDRSSVLSLIAEGNTSTYLFPQFGAGFAPFGGARFNFLPTDDSILERYAFRQVDSLRLLNYWRLPGLGTDGGTGYLIVDGGNGVRYATQNRTTHVGGGERTLDGTVAESMSKFWPPTISPWLESTSNMHTSVAWIDGMRLTVLPDAEAKSNLTLYAVSSDGLGHTSDADGFAIANGLATSADHAHEWNTGKIYFAAPLGTASIRRTTITWVGDTTYTVKWSKSDGTPIHTFARGDHFDVANAGLTIAELHASYVETVGGNPVVDDFPTWLRLVVEYEGSLTDTEYQTTQRMSSLATFDITQYIDTSDWQSLVVAGAANAGAVRVESQDSLGTGNGNELNNDSLWVVRVSYLVRAAPPVTQLARTVGVSVRGLIAEDSLGIESRAIGDIMVELLTGAAYLGIDGTEYFADGWVDVSTFHSDLSGPSFIANGAIHETQDAASTLADFAAQANGMIYWESGRLKFRQFVTSGWPSAAQSFGDDDIQTQPTRPTRAAETVLNKVTVEYSQDYVRRGYEATKVVENSTSVGKFGARRDEVMGMQLNDFNSQDAASVQDNQATALANSWLDRFGEPAQGVVLDCFLNAMAVEVGDIVASTASSYNAPVIEVTGMVVIPGNSSEIDRIRLEGLER